MIKKGAILLLLLVLFFSCSQEKKTNWSITLDSKSKDPYGCCIAYNSLSSLFPNSDIYTDINFITHIDDIVNQTESFSPKNNLTIFVTQNFILKEEEFDKVQSYLAMGNYLLVLSNNYSKNISTYFQVTEMPIFENQFSSTIYQPDTNNFSIRFNKKYETYQFIGRFNEFVFERDTLYSDSLNTVGYAVNQHLPNIIRSGNFIIARNPLAFTNHFLLQKNNREYYEKLLSYFPLQTKTVAFFSKKKFGNAESDSDISKLLQIPAIRYAFFIFIALLIIYTLFESKRRQKIIPILPINTNSSLEFAETIGMLYYNKKDNSNLSEKMISYYLEHLRSKYNIKTNELNDAFAVVLARKLNHPEAVTKDFVGYLNYIRSTNEVSDNDIQHLYHQLKKLV